MNWVKCPLIRLGIPISEPEPVIPGTWFIPGGQKHTMAKNGHFIPTTSIMLKFIKTTPNLLLYTLINVVVDHIPFEGYYTNHQLQ